MTQTQIPGTERAESPRLERLSEELRKQCVANAEGRAREKSLREQLLTELLGIDPARRELVEQLVALGPPMYGYVDGQGVEVESVMVFKLDASVHKTGKKASEPDETPTPPRAKKKPVEPVDPEAAAAAAAAAEDQRSNGVAEDEDGDVVPPEKPSKPSKKKRRR